MRIALFLLISVAAALPASAEIAVGYTAEWIAHQSRLVALATPLDVENIKGPGQVWFTRVRFRLDDVVKGPESKGDAVTIYDFSYKESDTLALDKARKESKQILVFAKVAEDMFEEIEGKYTFTGVRQFKSAYYPDRVVSKVFTPEFRLLTNFDELLKRTRAQVAHESDLIRRHWKGNIGRKSLEVPFDSEAHRYLYAGSLCYLWVPEYKEEK
jgi:hypothetical protein